MMTEQSYRKRFLGTYAASVLLAYALLLLASWSVSIYVDDIQALLAPRGIRWMCSNIASNFASAPLAPSLMLLMSVSIVRQSGLCYIFSERMSLKRQRAIRITSVVAVAILLLFSLLLFLPNAVLLSAFGTISHSAFSKGWFGLTVVYVSVVSSVYGYTSGRFSGVADVIDAHTSILSSLGAYVLIMFLVSQLIGAIRYTCVLPFLGDDGTWLEILSYALYYIPLCVYFLMAQKFLIPHSSHRGD